MPSVAVILQVRSNSRSYFLILQISDFDLLVFYAFGNLFQNFCNYQKKSKDTFKK